MIKSELDHLKKYMNIGSFQGYSAIHGMLKKATCDNNYLIKMN